MATDLPAGKRLSRPTTAVHDDAPQAAGPKPEAAPVSPHPQLDVVLEATAKRDGPAEYLADFCSDVVAVMGEGFSLTAFAGAINASRKDVDMWIADQPAFASAVERGRAARTRALEIQFLTAGTGAKVAAHVFALKNAAPQDWRERPDAETKPLPNITFVLNGSDGEGDLPRLDRADLLKIWRTDG